MDEVWVPTSDTIAGRITLNNQDFNALDLQFEVVGKLQAIDGTMINPLHGNLSDPGRADLQLQPVIYLTGGPEHGGGRFLPWCWIFTFRRFHHANSPGLRLPWRMNKLHLTWLAGQLPAHGIMKSPG